MQQYSHPNLFRRRERTAQFWPPPRPRHRCCRGAHRGLSLAPTLTADDGVWHAVARTITHDTSKAMSPAPPLRQLAGKTMLLVLQLLLRKRHGGAGAMVLSVECALNLFTGGPHSCQYTGRPLCASEDEARGSIGVDLWITRSMKVGRRGDVDKPAARRDGHRSSLTRLRHDVHAYHGRRGEELTSRRPV